MLTENELKMIIGSNVKRYRKQKGLTQKELSILIGVSTPLLGALESKNIIQGISVYTLYKLSKALNVTVDKFFAKPSWIKTDDLIK